MTIEVREYLMDGPFALPYSRERRLTPPHRLAATGARPERVLNLASYEADPETMVVPNAGETLFRLR